jgi:hypothetical protein
MRKLFTLFIVVVSSIFLAGNMDCEGGADAQQRQKTEEMAQEAYRQTGLPNIRNFTEKKFAKMIYELRDSEMTTYSYFMDMNGRLHFLCESIGYGLPYSVQYVNPERYHLNGATLPQPEPNGLFMPDSLSATWVLCSDKEGNIRPVYSEPPLIVSPFPLNYVRDIRK